MARAIAASVRDAGGRALIVGGWVRDLLRGQPSKDIDLEVFGIVEDQLAPLLAPFGRVEAVGQSFAVYKVIGSRGQGEGVSGQGEGVSEGAGVSAIDVALPRRESKAGRGHKGFKVVGDPAMSIEEAARRRDFTVNAISWDPLTDTYEDPFEGRTDIERRVLRVVDPVTFADDSLRV